MIRVGTFSPFASTFRAKIQRVGQQPPLAGLERLHQPFARKRWPSMTEKLPPSSVSPVAFVSQTALSARGDPEFGFQSDTLSASTSAAEDRDERRLVLADRDRLLRACTRTDRRAGWPWRRLADRSAPAIQLGSAKTCPTALPDAADAPPGPAAACRRCGVASATGATPSQRPGFDVTPPTVRAVGVQHDLHAAGNVDARADDGSESGEGERHVVQPGGTLGMRNRPEASVIALIASDPRTPASRDLHGDAGHDADSRLSVTDPAMPPAPAVAIAA